MNKKSQSAMEYLMTYGWAILVVLIALGALFYLGVFTPSVPSTCQFNTPFVCIGGDILGTEVGAATDTVTFKVATQGGTLTPTITGILIGGVESVDECTGYVAPDIALTSGLEQTVTCTGAYFSGSGEQFSGSVTFSYEGAAGTHTGSGSFSGTTE